MQDKEFVSLYHQIGGDAVLDKAIERFYDRVLADDRIRHFFDGVDMDRLRATQKTFLAYCFGGPYIYDGKAMRDAHHHLSLTEEHFQAVMQHLEDTLRELGVREDLVEAAVSIAASHHDEVLGL